MILDYASNEVVDISLTLTIRLRYIRILRRKIMWAMFKDNNDIQ